MKNFVRIWVVAIGLCSLPGLAQAADIFMLIQGVNGDSVAKGHERWIRVSSLEWQTVAESSWTQTGGASVGKPKPDKMELILPTGTWSQHFVRLITQGKAIASVVFDAVASDGRPLYRITAEGFFVTKYGIATLPATPLPQDHVAGVFRKVKIEYYATAADGRLVTTVVEWDVATGISTPPI